MKPKVSILDRAFLYKPSYATVIADTWRRFGWRPVKRNAQESQAQPRSRRESPRIWRSEGATFGQLLRTWQKRRATNSGGSI